MIADRKVSRSLQASRIRCSPVPEEPVGYREETILVVADEGRKGGLIAPPHPLNQQAVVRSHEDLSPGIRGRRAERVETLSPTLSLRGRG